MAIDPKYELLPESFEKRGRVFTLIQRTDTTTLYLVRVCGVDRFEVWRRKFNEGTTAKMPNGQTVVFLPKEAAPRDEDFGRTAWTYGRRDLAMDKFKELNGGDAVPPLFGGEV